MLKITCDDPANDIEAALSAFHVTLGGPVLTLTDSIDPDSLDVAISCKTKPDAQGKQVSAQLVIKKGG